MADSSTRFGFLAQHDPLLVSLASFAEGYATSDPNAALVKLRQFGEALLERIRAERADTPKEKRGRRKAHA